MQNPECEIDGQPMQNGTHNQEALDIQLKDGKIDAYRAKVKVSFKFDG